MDMRYFNGRFPCMEPGTGPSAGAYSAYGQGAGAGAGYGAGAGAGYGPGGVGSGMTPGMNPGMIPGMTPGMNPGMMPGMNPGMMPGMMPGMNPGMMPGMMPGMNPGMMPGMMPGMNPGMMPGMGPGYGNGPCNGINYTIQAGETLQDIAQKYGMAVDELLRVNPSLNPNYYRAGDRLCIPMKNSADAQAVMMYTVEPADTLSDICIKCNTSVDVLRYGNPGFDCRNLMAGTRLRICPMPAEPRCRGVRSQMIPEGMDLVSCARALGVSTDELLLANPNYQPSRFAAGNAICLPDA